jgi:signal peptidase I
MIRRAIFLLALGIAGAYSLRTFLYEPAIVESASMDPTLFEGTHYLVNKWAYRFAEPKRGDIISFRSPVDHESLYMKRVIAIPGDEVEMKQKNVYVNGKELDEPYAQHKMAKKALEGDTLGPLKVPEDHYFVLGDNRDVSYDSTVWRDKTTNERIYFLPKDHIRGRVIIF